MNASFVVHLNLTTQIHANRVLGSRMLGVSILIQLKVSKYRPMTSLPNLNAKQKRRHYHLRFQARKAGAKFSNGQRVVQLPHNRFITKAIRNLKSEFGYEIQYTIK